MMSDSEMLSDSEIPSASERLSTQKMPPPIDATYTFVWEQYALEQPQVPKEGSIMHITSVKPTEHSKSQTSDNLNDPELLTSTSLQSPKPQGIYDTPNSSHCTAKLSYRNYTIVFHCTYDLRDDRFTTFMLNEKETSENFLNDWGPRDIDVGNAPFGFHKGMMQGTRIFDDQGKDMLLVYMDDCCVNARLYGKRATPGKKTALLTKGERERLNLEYDPEEETRKAVAEMKERNVRF
ncbi:hypothetical protein ACLMJK_007032 [Lecanora helva]